MQELVGIFSKSYCLALTLLNHNIANIMFANS